VRPALSQEAIVAAAVGLVDEHGPDALTMRAVAERLGCGVMSLYRHVPDRETLLDLALDAMTAELPATPPTGDWRADATALARDVRSGLLKRPHLTVLLTSRGDRRSGGLKDLDRALGIFRSAGFAERDAVFANHVLGNYVAGAALWEAVGLGGSTGADRQARRAAGAAAVQALPPDLYPNVSWAGAQVFAGDLDGRFDFGLEVILDGFERRLHATATDS
jgi:AcrR family transcriptional regulator